MKLSVIVLNYKTKELTLSCLKTIDRYPLLERFEVIVVDNNSADGSVSYLRKYKPKNYKFSVIANTSNSGFAKGNNLGIRKAKGEYILLLNSDTEVLSGTLNELVNFAIRNKDAGVIAPRLLNPDKTVQPSVFRLPTIRRAIREYIFGEKGVLDKHVPKVSKPTLVEGVVGAAFLVTPEARRRVGLLDERYFMYFEDLDYCRKVKKAGLKVYYLPSIKVVHVHGASGESNPKQTERLIEASKVYHGVYKYYLLTAIIKVGSKLTGTSAVLMFAIAGALVMRFFHFPDNIYFAYDQARDAFMAQEILAGDLKIVGPPASIEGMFHGVLYWYLLAPLYFISQGSVVFVAGFLRVANVLSVVLIYLVGKTLADKKVGLAAASIYAFSFENWQEALYFANPAPAVVTSLLFYYGLIRVVKTGGKLGDWAVIALGLGLSIQFQFYLVYLFATLFLVAVMFWKKVVRSLSFKKVIIFFGGLTISLSTFLLGELKFGMRLTNSVLGIFDGQESSKSTSDRFFEWVDKIALTTKDTLGFPTIDVSSLFVVLVILGALFVIYKNKKTRVGGMFLAGWMGSTALLYLIVGHNTYYIIGLAAGIILVFALFINSVDWLRKYQVCIVVLVVMLNLIAVGKQAKAGIVTEISVQEGMRYGDEVAVVDYIYQDAESSEIVVSALTMPYDIYPTWAYLFHNYGAKKYGYLPYWVKKGVEGYPGRLPVPADTVCQRYTIYESVRGIEQLEEMFRKDQDLTTELQGIVQIGEFTVEKRYDRACL